MGNTLTGLIVDAYAGLDTVSRELVGAIPAVRRDSSAEMAAVGQTITFPVVPAMTIGDVAAAATGPDPDAQTIGSDTTSISKSKNTVFYWEGEEQKGLNNSGIYNTILADQFAQSYRTLANAVETDLCSQYKYASRAYGAAGTTPFGTADQLDDLSYTLEILDKNGAPATDRHAVLDTKAMANLRGYQGIVFKANEAGNTTSRTTGAIGELYNTMLHTSGQVAKHTAGTAANYDSDLLAGYSVGDSTIHVDTGTGTIVAGDIITFSGNTADKYVIKTGFVGDGDGDIVIQNPGLVNVGVADGEDMVTTAAYRANMVFHRNAILLATRVPAMPAGGDSADDVMVVTDPVSGLSFQIAMYRQRRRVAFEVSLAWGYKTVKPEHLAILIG